MSDKKIVPASVTKPAPAVVRLQADTTPMFSRINYILMAVGAIIIMLGMFVMAGGKSSDPNVFDYNQVYSKTRITVAPILIIAGIIVEIFAIFKNSPGTE